jgi:hypothetical protein
MREKQVETQPITEVMNRRQLVGGRVAQPRRFRLAYHAAVHPRLLPVPLAKPEQNSPGCAQQDPQHGESLS